MTLPWLALVAVCCLAVALIVCAVIAVIYERFDDPRTFAERPLRSVDDHPWVPAGKRRWR